MIVCFVSEQKPLSIQAKRLDNYKKRLQQEFDAYKSIFPNLPINENIYSKIIYIYSKSSDIDVDNMSKPFVDRLRE